ncbi:hypothetical protein HOE04_00765 [archaeon]|nr:hypothetical protein [archaeon]
MTHPKTNPPLEIYDCTLREGEQAKGASFTLKNRLELCQLLDDFKVDYIELGWPIVSQEIRDAFKIALEKTKYSKIVAFGSTSRTSDPQQDKNLNSIIETGVKYSCIFGKTHLTHIQKQLKISPNENLERISQSIEYLKQNNITTFYDAEHYFDGFKDNPEYALQTLTTAIQAGAERVILCDTNGGMLPEQVKEILSKTKTHLENKNLNSKLGVHFHDDCNLALANTLASLPYITQVQGTINGIGERIGNLNLTTFLAIYLDKLHPTTHPNNPSEDTNPSTNHPTTPSTNNLNINLQDLKKVNKKSFRLCGITMQENQPFVGDTAFAHRGGVHIDAIKKGASYEHSTPEKFGNKSRIILNSLGGASSVIEVARQFNYHLDKKDPTFQEKTQQLFNELRQHEKAGYDSGTHPAEQFLLINKYFGNHQNLFTIKKWKAESKKENNKETSEFYALCKINQETLESQISLEGGPIEAGFNTLKEILSNKYPQATLLHLSDFKVTIARESEEESTVRTEIKFKNGTEFSTIGVDRNIIGSAVEALEKGFKYQILKTPNPNY